LRQDQEGAAIEQYFYSEIYKNSNIFISTFRTKNNLEVDFILTLPDKTLMAIELKKDQFIYAADLQGLHFFDKQLPVNKKLFVFHSGTRENDEGKIAIMPIDKGISIIHQL
jgi:predicted AAA+ superfamily ATPase